MRRRLFVTLFCFAASLSNIHAIAAEVNSEQRPPVVSPVAPRESIKNIVVPDGLKVELVTCEPQVIDPVAIRFDERGRLWVVEMRDYPTGPTKKHPARSRISLLTDNDGDGFYETAKVFADNLKFATGVQPWQGGVFVTMAGEVAYMKDTNGDDKADLIETWYTGFAQGNQQLRANHPRLALDNHIYIANGLRGGNIIDARNPDAKPVSISGRDFRFDPFTRKFEPVSGDGQFGMTFDDYGNRFICMNRNPAMHVVLEDWQLKKNPLVTVAAVTHDVAKIAGQTRLFPIAKSWTTSHLHANQFTAACATEIYRGDALPREYYGNFYTCDPTAHLVHREVMKPLGVTFTSTTPNLGTEFFASRDTWCSPVNLESGPDGALYVVDMYRAVIEHPEWVPDELKKRPDQMLGNDMGRIYRIVSSNFRWPSPRDLSEASSAELVELLVDPNAWTRETASRLLLERQDNSAAPHVKRMITEHTSPLARLHALRLMNGLGIKDDSVIMRALKDSDPRVIEQAIIASDLLDKQNKDWNQLRTDIARLRENADARVRFQALLVARPALLPPKYPADKWEIDAMLISAGKHCGSDLSTLLLHPDELKANISDPKKFIADLSRQVAALRDADQNVSALSALIRSQEFGRVGLGSFFSEALRQGLTLAGVRSHLSPDMQRDLDRALDDARRNVTDPSKSLDERCEAVDLVAVADDGARILVSLATTGRELNLKQRAISALAKRSDIKVWRQLLGIFSVETPQLQRALLAGVLMDPARISLLFDEIEAGHIKPTQFDANHLKLLLENPDPTIKNRAAQLLAAAIPPDRTKVLADYKSVLAMKGDTLRGRVVFEKRCATCHRVFDVGIQFAPDISDSREKTPEQLLVDIIQPSRSIDANFFSYTAITTSGQVHTGVLAGETSTTVTLKQAEGKSVTLRRDEIDELHSDGVSFMPEGLEKDIPLPDMADLISFIKNWRYLADGRDIPGVK
jgi:putative membrane-bound dehydrogenase-like protein